MNDHKKQAEELLDGFGDSLSMAQVHATLYLAEQQRIANLIAFATLEHGQYKELQMPERGDVLAEIREGLGI